MKGADVIEAITNSMNLNVLVGLVSQKKLVPESVDKCFGLFVCLFSQKKLVS